MFEVIIKNGQIVDGTGDPGFKGDIGIENGKITEIGDLGSAKGQEIIDAKGLTVSPGFIDIHNHSDFEPLMDANQMSSEIRQGVTTVLVGNCAKSAAPIRDLMMDPVWTTIENPSPTILEKAGVMVCKARSREDIGKFYRQFGVNLDWSTLSEYFNRITERGSFINRATLVGHASIRLAVIGFENRPPTKKELTEMKRLISEAMEQGAFGLSTGLVYPPSSFADMEEIVELCRTVQKYGGIHCSHIRGEQDSVMTAIQEAIRIGQEAEIPVEISHIKTKGRNNWGRAEEALEMIRGARARGVDVTCDQYPYRAQGMYCLWLSHMLPAWTFNGGMPQLLENLKDNAFRNKVKKEVINLPGEANLVNTAGWENIIIIGIESEKNKSYEGMSVAEITELRNVDNPLDVVFDFLIDEKGEVPIIVYLMSEEDVQTFMRYPGTMIGSDGGAPTLPGYFGKGIVRRGKPTPKHWSTFPRVLGRYVRDTKTLQLEEAIRKMTSMPAQKIGLKARGLLKKGMWADITIFDASTIIDKGTFVDPTRYPEGIEHLLINGKIVMTKGSMSDTAVGEVLRRT